MNGTITISVPERTRNAFAAASPYQREAAVRRFAETLEMPEQELYPTDEDARASFERIDEYNRENNVSPIEDLDELLAKFDAEERQRIAEIGDEAYIAELDALQDGEVYKDDDER